MKEPRVLLVTGRPEAGKTTLIRKVAARLTRRRLGGFYTEEIRRGGAREGFRLVTFDGREAVMAHTRLPGPPRVGRYGVDVAVIDELTDSALGAGPARDVYLVDEIGKMECFSRRFVSAVRALLEGRRPVVATVGARGGGFIAEVTERPDTERLTLTLANRDALVEEVVAWVTARAAPAPRRAPPPPRGAPPGPPRR
jgi:nucleoside-triphosphatase